ERSAAGNPGLDDSTAFQGVFRMLNWKHLASWLRIGGASGPRGTRRARQHVRRCLSRKPGVELLEDRTVLSPLQAGPVGLHATEGIRYDGAVTTFTDGNTQDTAANFTATISWGDSTSSPGTVSGSAGHFTVLGQHTYVEEGNYPLSVVIREDNG